jgi:hypothetical protein
MRAEEVDQLGLPLAEQVDLPGGLKRVWIGADLGLGDSPTVFSVFSQEQVRMTGDRRARERLKLVRRLTCQRFRQRQIVELWLALGFHFGTALQGVGVDSTGLGFPIVQAMEDDQGAPAHLH